MIRLDSLVSVRSQYSLVSLAEEMYGKNKEPSKLPDNACVLVTVLHRPSFDPFSSFSSFSPFHSLFGHHVELSGLSVTAVFAIQFRYL